MERGYDLVSVKEEGSCEHEEKWMALGSRREVWAGLSGPTSSPPTLLCPMLSSSPLALEQMLGMRFRAQMQDAYVDRQCPQTWGVLLEFIF